MMRKIILFGAGVRGKQVADLLKRKGILIHGFCDSNKAGEQITVGDDVYVVYTIEYIVENKEKYSVVVTIADYKEINIVDEKLRKLGVDIITIEEVLDNQTIGAIARNRQYIADFHLDEMEGYYRNGEAESELQVFWRKDSEFKKMFSRLDISNVIELACGHGRHVPYYIENAGKVMLVDILEKNINYCRKRFQNNIKIQYYVNNGYDLRALPSESYSSLFTYDAMVHFEMMDIFEYLKETKRILKPGGRALFHHSNNTEDYRITFSTGTYGRNYMSSQLFAYLANRVELKIVDQKVIDWAGKRELDCLTLVEKK